MIDLNDFSYEISRAIFPIHTKRKIYNITFNAYISKLIIDTSKKPS